MKQIALKYFTNIDLPLLAMILFFCSFCFLIYRVYFFEPKENFDFLSQIPLQDEEKNNV